MKAEEELTRCNWGPMDATYQKYHDTEWGIPKKEDAILFEMLLLEGAQAGLSWKIILDRRENYRKAFDNFDVKKIANYQAEDVERLRSDKGIIRNKLKINSAIKNAKAFIQIQEEYGSFSSYIWGYVNQIPIIHHFKSMEEVPATIPLAETISKDLKKRGMTFVGPIIIYSYMQAIGMVNDHIESCSFK